MGYGYRRGFAQEVALPELMAEAEVEAQFAAPERRPELPKFMPISVIHRNAPEIAKRLHTLWGYPGFSHYVASITGTGPDRRGPPLSPEVLNAVLALDRYHTENRTKKLGPITVRLPNPMQGPTVRVGEL